MKRILAALLILTSGPAIADEYYEFYRIHCMRSFSAIEIEHVYYWDIGELVWPGQLGWKDHIAALKKLEKNDELYVFDQDYGYFDKANLKFDCGSAHASIAVKSRNRPDDGGPGSGEPVRIDPKVTILWDGKKIVSALSLGSVTKLRVYGPIFIDACTTKGCDDYQIWQAGPLTDKNLSTLNPSAP